MKLKSATKKLFSLVLMSLLILVSSMNAFAASGITILLKDLTVAPGDTITIPILVTENSGFGGFQGKLTYDTDALTFQSVEQADLTKGGLMTSKNENGTLTFSFANMDQITGTGVLVNVKFVVADDASGTISLSLSMPQMFAYDSEKNPVAISVSISNGTLTVESETVSSSESSTPGSSSSESSDSDESTSQATDTNSSDTQSTASDSSNISEIESSISKNEDGTPETGSNQIFVILIGVATMGVCGALFYLLRKKTVSQ